MQSKINWIDNLRGIACLMVVMIHTTTWYVTNAHSISPVNWDVANILNSDIEQRNGAVKQQTGDNTDEMSWLRATLAKKEKTGNHKEQRDAHAGGRVQNIGDIPVNRADTYQPC